MKKTLKKWEKSEGLHLSDYLETCDEVDEALYMHFLEVVVPRYHFGGLFQSGEAEREEGGRRYYMTFQQIGEKYYYLGVLPAFKQPKS